MPRLRWHGGNIVLSDEDIQAILAKRALVRSGEASPTETCVSSYVPSSYIVRDDYWDDSATECRRPYFIYYPHRDQPFLFIVGSGATQPKQGGLRQAYDKAATQMKQANIRDDYPRTEEPIEESGFVYPTDNVISIRKGRRLNRRG